MQRWERALRAPVSHLWYVGHGLSAPRLARVAVSDNSDRTARGLDIFFCMNNKCPALLQTHKSVKAARQQLDDHSERG